MFWNQWGDPWKLQTEDSKVPRQQQNMHSQTQIDLITNHRHFLLVFATWLHAPLWSSIHGEMWHLQCFCRFLHQASHQFSWGCYLDDILTVVQQQLIPHHFQLPSKTMLLPPKCSTIKLLWQEANIDKYRSFFIIIVFIYLFTAIVSQKYHHEASTIPWLENVTLTSTYLGFLATNFLEKNIRKTMCFIIVVILTPEQS